MALFVSNQTISDLPDESAALAADEIRERSAPEGSAAGAGSLATASANEEALPPNLEPEKTCKPIFTASLPQPPFTNRGAIVTTISAPNENRSLVDWVAFTFKVDDPKSVPELIGLDPSLFTVCSFGFSGYRKSLRFGNISIYFDGREGMGCHVEMSGQGCRHYEAQFSKIPWDDLFDITLTHSAKFTRLDLAIDNVDSSLSLDKIWDAIQDHDRCIRTKFGEWRRIQKGRFKDGEKITGDTIYLGSAKSRVQFRIYDKAQEAGVPGHWIRFEIQLRDSRATEAVKLLDSDILVGELASGIINNYFAIINPDDSNISRCSLQSWWSEWLQSTEKIKLSTEKEIKLVSDTMEFIKKQYAPSLAMINRHLGGSFKEFMNDVLEDGNERMNGKHERILAASNCRGGGKK